jgi:internalin A
MHFPATLPAAAVTTVPVVAAATPATLSNDRHAVARPLRVMYSYSHQDELFKDELHTALAALRREGAIDVWQDRHILPGSEFDKDIGAALEASDIIILLVSKYFIASDYCWSVEMKRAIERHVNGTAAVVPVILKPADWKTSPFGKLTALPKDGKPIVEWQNPDAAWANVAEGVRRLAMAKRIPDRS